MSAHALLSPSGSKQWAVCTGSIAASKHITKRDHSKDAASGTLTHFISQQVLEYDTPLQAFRPGTIWYVVGELLPDGEVWETCTQESAKRPAEEYRYTFKLDQDRIDRVDTYTSAIRRTPGTRYVEVKLDTSEVLGVPDQSGTSDIVIADIEASALSVEDLKDGVGVVYADSWQLRIYLCAAMLQFDLMHPFKKFIARIHQPRTNHFDEKVYTREELQEFMSFIRPRAQEAYALWKSGTEREILAALVPGDDQCRWCPIRGSCKKRAGEILELFPVVGAAFESGLLLDNAALNEAHKRVDEIEHWCNDIKSELTKRVLSGAEGFPDWKLVPKRKGARFWIDEKKAEANVSLLLDDSELYAPREIITPTAMEKVLKKKGVPYTTVSDLVGQEEGGYHVARVTDERPAVVREMPEFGLVT